MGHHRPHRIQPIFVEHATDGLQGHVPLHRRSRFDHGGCCLPLRINRLRHDRFRHTRPDFRLALIVGISVSNIAPVSPSWAFFRPQLAPLDFGPRALFHFRKETVMFITNQPFPFDAARHRPSRRTRRPTHHSTKPFMEINHANPA